jgi:hypothetical protein
MSRSDLSLVKIDQMLGTRWHFSRNSDFTVNCFRSELASREFSRAEGIDRRIFCLSLKFEASIKSSYRFEDWRMRIRLTPSLSAVVLYNKSLADYPRTFAYFYCNPILDVIDDWCVVGLPDRLSIGPTVRERPS